MTTGFQPVQIDRTADRALDEWLAEHLLAWPLERVRHQTFHADTHTLVPAFSLRDALAFSHILPALEAQGWTWLLSKVAGGDVFCRLYFGGANGIRRACGEGARTVAMAVALAARKAIEPPAVEYTVVVLPEGAIVDCS